MKNTSKWNSRNKDNKNKIEEIIHTLTVPENTADSLFSSLHTIQTFTIK